MAQCLFESDSNNRPSPQHSSLVSDEVYLFKFPIYDFLVVYNDFNSDVSKQIRLCTGSGASIPNGQVTLT